MVRYDAPDISADMSFLEMLDVVNEGLIEQGRDPDRVRSRLPRGHLRLVRLMINGVAARPDAGHRDLPAAHAPAFKDGDEIYDRAVARARPFPVVKDLVVDRSAFDRIIAAGGFISVPTGSAPDGNASSIAKDHADTAMDAAACIGCGACVAACPNASASLFTAAKITHLGLLPQGQPERLRRARRMVTRMDVEGFGGCTLFGECQEACPKQISIDTITMMNRDFLRAALVPEAATGAESD